MLWKNQQTGIRIKFISDVLMESLFDFAFDSYKIPSLNLHYFCQDYLMTAKLVDEKIIDDGNMIPLYEEFESLIDKAIWLPEGVSKSILSYKNKKGYFENITDKSDDKIKFKYYQENAKFISTLLESNDNYLEQLIFNIKNVLSKSEWEVAQKEIVYHCIRELISELLNLGLNKKYIYNKTKNKLKGNDTEFDDITYVERFLRSLIPKSQKFVVIIGVTNDVYVELHDKLKGIRLATDAEKVKLQTSYVIEFEYESCDSFSALTRVKGIYSVILSIYNACCHNTNLKILPNGLVSIGDNNHCFLIRDNINLLSKNLNKQKQIRKRWLDISMREEITSNLISAFELHNSALNIEDPQSQFLNLWTIIELLIKTNQNLMSRINYVTNNMCSILCVLYYSRIVECLYNDIRRHCNIDELVCNESRGANSQEKLAYILKDNQNIRQKLVAELASFPLLIYRIEKYSKIFSSKEQLYSDLKRHSNRLRWQIMRIYRNRCMIVHNGQHFPYLNSALENLHYYVDELFNYIFAKLELGIADLDAILTLARIKEKNKYEILKNQLNAFTDEEFYSIIFEI